MAWGQGERDAFDRLVPLVNGELRMLARRHMAGERPGHTLQATALMNEAYFAGLTLDDTSEALQVSTDTVKRDWRFAKIWLLRELGGTKHP